MLLRRTAQVVVPPGSPSAIVTGQTLNVLRNTVGNPQYNKGAQLLTGWETEADGQTVNVQSFEQKWGDSTISFVDGGRFIAELNSTTTSTTRLPCMPRMIHVPGQFIASTSPLAIDMAEEEDQMINVLRQAGFTVTENDFWKLPCYVYRMTNLTVKKLFGDDFAPLFDFARMFRRYGPGELMLQALQHDSDKRHLMSLSDIVGVKVESAGDELGTLLDALELGSFTELVSLLNMVNAMTSMRFAKVLTTAKDEAGVGMTLYYAMMDAAYLCSLPLDMVQAFGAGDSTGKVTLNTFEGVVIPQLEIQIREEDKIHIPTLRSITAGAYESMQKARLLYRMMLVVRFMEYRGYPLTVDTTLKSTDRRQFFELLM